MFRTKLWLFVCGGALFGLVATGFGHSTGHESRLAAHCQKLPSPERQACMQCVGRPIKHHYHPDYPPGARCRLDNGKP